MARLNLTYLTGLVLQAIEHGHRYGFDIMDASGLPDGTVYPALRRLEAAGYLSSEWEEEAKASAEKRPQRRNYELTPEGVALLKKARERFRGLVLAPAPDSAMPDPERA